MLSLVLADGELVSVHGTDEEAVTAGLELVEMGATDLVAVYRVPAVHAFSWDRERQRAKEQAAKKQ